MVGLTDLLIALTGIAASGFQIGWPLLIVACGLAGVAYFGGKNWIKTVGAWIIALAGLSLFLLNVKRVIG